MVRSEKTNSATTVGCSAVIRHERRPFRPSLSVESFATADSMSAAVVPGAKFEAVTEKGPAFPLILRPRAKGFCLGDGVILAWSEFRAEANRF